MTNTQEEINLSLFDDNDAQQSTGDDSIEFRPEKAGESLEGTFAELSEPIPGNNGGSYHFLFIDVKGERHRVMANKVLLEKVQSLPLRQGDPIAVRWDGKKKSRSGNDYNVWSVAAKPSGEAQKKAAGSDSLFDD